MSLFSGKGYDQEFTCYLQQLVGELADEPATEFILVKGEDNICAHCPNLNDNHMCSFGNEDILQKDKQVLTILKLEHNDIYVYSDMVERIKLYMTSEAFEACCSTCRWFKSGLCSYDKLIENL
jgi:hypothetical protein